MKHKKETPNKKGKAKREREGEINLMS